MSGKPKGFLENGVVWAAPPPPGITRNTVNQESLGPMSIGINSVFYGLALLFTIVRIYTRLAIHYSPGFDDLFIVIATLLQGAYYGIEVFLCAKGFIGKHLWETPLSVLFGPAIGLSKKLAILQPLTLMFLKLGILWLYHRLFAPNKLVRWGTWFGLAMVPPVYLLFTLFWGIADERDDRQISFNHAFGVINLITDIYILGLPIIAVWNLQLRTRRKIGVIAIFATGLAGVAMGILGMVYRFQFLAGNQKADSTWQAVPRFTVNMVEIDVGIMCACMPVFPALFRKGKRPEMWLTTLRSLGTRLLTSRRSNSSHGSSNASNRRTADVSGIVKTTHIKSDYMELEDGASFNKASSTEAGRSAHSVNSAERSGKSREWYDTPLTTTSVNGK